MSVNLEVMKLHFILHHDAVNVIGVTGVVLVLVAYLLLQIDRMSQDGIFYSLFNFVGSILILYSLFFFWNLASFVIEISWLIISTYGLVKAIKLRLRKRIVNRP